MLSPSTAPRWKRQTKMRRSGGRADGRTAKAARARNNGSKPRLNNARPPDFTKTRLEIVIVIAPSFRSARPPYRPSAASLPLKLRPPDRESDGQGPGLDGVLHVGQLLADHAFRVLGHGPAQNPVIDRGDEVLHVHGVGSDGVECHGRPGKSPGRERYGGVHAAVRRIVVHEPLAQLAAEVMRGGRVIGEQLEQADTFVHPLAALELETEHLLVAGVVGPVVELEVSALLRAPDAPPGEDAGDFDHVVLVVAAVHAERVELE